MIWTKKKRGFSTIWVSDKTLHAIVDKRGFGSNPGIFWNGRAYPSVEEAKQAAETER